MNRLVAELVDVAKPEVSPRMEGRRLWTVVAPK
jgi:translation initiation factor IF-3